MKINLSVHYNGGLFPDIILLTRCGYIGEPFLYHEEVLFLHPMFPPKPLDIVSPEGGCSEGLDAFRFFLKVTRRIYMPRRYVGLGPSRVHTRIPSTRRLGQRLSLRKILRCFRVR